MVASATSFAAEANADNTRARAFFLLFLLFILIVIILKVTGIILDRPSLPFVRRAPLKRIRTAGGHGAHRKWARLLLDRRRDLIDHGPRATRSASGKTDERSSSSSTTATTTTAALGSSVLTSQTERASEAPFPCHTA